MKYGEIIYGSFGSLIPQLLLLPNRSLGKLARHVLEQCVQKPHTKDLSPDLMPMAARLMRGMMVMYDQALPPTLTILMPRMHEMLPALLALGSRDTGRIMHAVVQEICGSKDHACSSLRLENHLQDVRTWLWSDMEEERDLRRIASFSLDAATRICDVVPAGNRMRIAQMTCIQIICHQDFSSSSAEKGMLRLAVALANGAGYTEGDIVRLCEEAMREKAPARTPVKEKAAAPAPRPAPPAVESSQLCRLMPARLEG